MNKQMSNIKLALSNPDKEEAKKTIAELCNVTDPEADYVVNYTWRHIKPLLKYVTTEEINKYQARQYLIKNKIPRNVASYVVNMKVPSSLKSTFQIVIKHPEIWQKDSVSGKWVQKDSLYYVSNEGAERIENTKRNKFGCDQNSGGFHSFHCISNSLGDSRTYLFGTPYSCYSGDEKRTYYRLTDLDADDKYMYIPYTEYDIGVNASDDYIKSAIKVPLINNLVMKTPFGFAHVSERKVVDYTEVVKWTDEDFDNAKSSCDLIASDD